MKRVSEQAGNPDGNPQAHVPGMPVIAVIGDGQLARMMQTAAIELGQSLRLLAGARDASAAQVCADVVLGDYTNYDDLLKAVDGATAVTFDHEHVPNEHLTALIDAGYNVQPQPAALINAQDKLVMRERLAELGAPVPRFAPIESAQDAYDFWTLTSGQVCLKARRGGYDGKGVWFPNNESELTALVSDLSRRGVALMAEEKVALVRELSVLVARTPSGEVATWPLTESVQRNGVCAEAVAPAPGVDPQLQQRAETLGEKIATELGVTGVLAVELFAFANESGAEDIAVNELAMRPHNTGHWTLDGSVTSQFEQHLRAVMDEPLGDTSTLAPVTVMANVLGADEDPKMPMGERAREVARRFPRAKVHLYGKGHRPGRKIGHVNLTGEDVEATRRDARLAADFLVNAAWSDNWSAK
ncbi:5-(carboxyamino)imidazole ribonucleotide synthase [Corynebacterium stationis]|uniref:5-(carboxyamino)imidazole ribonucleotide synthase n=1 Tax=Corynebacterium stationis TaxID=1705 RepID=UPI00076F64B3|nr:5-(carboxyamino)imidazole ribonucleotide synthase [Corynebacterium stationis]AQX70511.1 5-(carboxyamino)imidazole ribonucleotide synthase [Corynebacterium stationis]ASJ18203.1 5-(carboxyamino)imidazole ribonucleotide synthase [Corynebacterium stationis]